MKSGFTTGSCAAAAAKAAAMMLLLGGSTKQVDIITPKGVIFSAKITDIERTSEYVSCAVIKDGGDDPDVTDGAKICVRAAFGREDISEPKVSIDAGVGVGRVTKPGLDRPVGDAAINSVPRRMITEAVLDVCDMAGYGGEICITVSVPGGDKIAKRTFNPRLGIEGGISIIGTSGIVEPMSERAIIDTIRVELRQRRALGYDAVVITPGNYGRGFLNKTYGYDDERSVKCSNFIGDTIDSLCEFGFKSVVLTGHMGKLVKIAGGIMNTHSKEADCRMEILSSAFISEGGDIDPAKRILSCITTEEALGIIEDAGLIEPVCNRLLERIIYYLDKRAKNALSIDCVLFSNEQGLLAKSEGADKWLTLLGQAAEQ